MQSTEGLILIIFVILKTLQYIPASAGLIGDWAGKLPPACQSLSETHRVEAEKLGPMTNYSDSIILILISGGQQLLIRICNATRWGTSFDLCIKMENDCHYTIFTK